MVVSRQRILIIGSSSETGIKLIESLSEQTASKRPILFAFCSDPQMELDQSIKERCNGVIRGEYDDPSDIDRAMKKSCADTVIWANAGTDGRSAQRAALDAVLERPSYQYVKLIVLTAAEKEDDEQKEVKKTKKVRRGISKIWSYVTCSVSSDVLSDVSQRSLCSPPLPPPPPVKSRPSIFRKRPRTSKDKLEQEEKELEMKPTSTSTVTSTLYMTEMDASHHRRQQQNHQQQQQQNHVRVKKENVVDYVVGAVMDSRNDDGKTSTTTFMTVNHPPLDTIVLVE